MGDDIKMKVLCVDDEERMLQAISRTLTFRGSLDVHTATEGRIGLSVLEREGPFAVVISDLRMPQMDGMEFLGHVRQRAPDSVRILLTGEHEFDAAVTAVNSGTVFRFLSKPCPTPVLLQTVEAAVAQHQLIVAERVLLQKTLRGCINTLTNLLALVSPEAFARANRIARHVLNLNEHLGLASDWQVEIAAMLSQIGGITLPPETAERLYHGRSLSEEETRMVERLPEVAVDLLHDIPRLDEVKRIIRYQHKRFDGGGLPTDTVAGGDIPFGARLLKIALDFEALEAAGHQAGDAISMLRERADCYDPDVLDALGQLYGTVALPEQIKAVSFAELCTGMVLADDVKTKTDLILMGRGQEITDVLMARLHNLSTRISVIEPIHVRWTGGVTQDTHTGAYSPPASAR